jgi:hypothetical protein
MVTPARRQRNIETLIRCLAASRNLHSEVKKPWVQMSYRVNSLGEPVFIKIKSNNPAMIIKNKYRKRKTVDGEVGLEELLSFWDLQLQQTVSYSPEELDKKLKEFKVSLEKHVKTLSEIAGYKLTSFTVKVALKGNVFVASAEGGIELKFDKI